MSTNKRHAFAAFTLIILVIVLSFAGEESAFAGKKGRKFYLSMDPVTGSQAPFACNQKFHMASIWEILDVSNLQYDTKNGIVLDDSGSGPPTTVPGWIRTGFANNISSNTPGVANCNAYTTDNGNGTRIFLPADLNSASNVSSPWKANIASCGNQVPVWCVQN
jgi:hypothetical protein